jgi:hypothetical protein
VTTRRVAWLLIGMALLLGACSGSSSKKPAFTPTTTGPVVSATRAAIPDSVSRPQFDKIDTNHDGVISAAEKDAAVKADFAAMDVNHDGVVTIDDIKAEVAGSKQAKPVDRPLYQYLAFDYDHNGTIDFAEYQQHVAERFGAMKHEADGSYSWADVKAFYQRTLLRLSTTTTKSGLLDGSAAALLLVPFAAGRRIRRGAVIVGMLAAVLIATAVPAGASAVYNFANQPYEIAFTCGTFCGNQWNITNQGSGNWEAYPGTAGTYFINNDPNVGCEDISVDEQQGVPDHGWSDLRSSGSKPSNLSWTDLDNNGNNIATISPLSLGACIA